MNKFILCGLGLTILLSGCSIGPPKKTFEATVQAPKEVVASRLNNLAKQCWTKKFDWFNDKVTVTNAVQMEGITIKASRYAPDIGSQPAHVEVYVSDSQVGGSLVEVLEQKNRRNELTKDIRYWLSGKNSCRRRKK